MAPLSLEWRGEQGRRSGDATPIAVSGRDARYQGELGDDPDDHISADNSIGEIDISNQLRGV